MNRYLELFVSGYEGYGMNFGITLSLWDYLFGTAYIPSDGRDIELGFPGSEAFPRDFVHQNLHGLRIFRS